MDYIQFFGLLIPLTAFLAFIYLELKDWRQETRTEIQEIRKEIRQQPNRSDRLYEMFIDLLKETKAKTDP